MILWVDGRTRPTVLCLQYGHEPVFDGSDRNLVTGEFKLTYHCLHCGAKGTDDTRLDKETYGYQRHEEAEL